MRATRRAPPCDHESVELETAELVIGRRTATMTLGRYGHPFPDRLDELADRLDDATEYQDPVGGDDQ